MNRTTKLDGVVPVIPIPFTDDASIDEAALRNDAQCGCAKTSRVFD